MPHDEQGWFAAGVDFSFGMSIPLREVDATITRALPVGPERAMPAALGLHELETSGLGRVGLAER